MPTNEADRIKFPHLLPGETSTWRQFLLLHQTEYDRFDYDVHLGNGSLPQEEKPTVYGTDFQWLTRKRADVIGWQGSLATIFEVRPRASLPLLGQLEGYRYLWMRANKDSLPPKLILVTEFIQPDDLEIFNAHGIPVVVVEPGQ